MGNLLVVLVICLRSHMQTTTNMYILNMAVADMLMCLGEEKHCRSAKVYCRTGVRLSQNNNWTEKASW